MAEFKFKKAISQFKGMVLHERPEPELRLGTLTIAENIYLTNSGKIRRRNGYSELISGNMKSVWGKKGHALGVLNNDLVRINSDWTTTTLLENIGSNPVSYDLAPNGTIYLTNNSIIGKVIGNTYSALDAPLEESRMYMPPGTIIKHFSGVLYVAAGRVLWFSDATRPEVVDARENARMFSSEITMIEPVRTGIFIGTEDNTSYITGRNPKKGRLIEKADYGVIGGGKSVEGWQIGRDIPKDSIVVFWFSKKGICLGADDGYFENITIDQMPVPSDISKASGIFIEQADGTKQYTVATY